MESVQEKSRATSRSTALQPEAFRRREKMSTVCVTGAAGYIGSYLVMKLLDRGCTVHATLRNLGDGEKTELLRGLPGSKERLRLFEADIYDAATFEPAISGCEFVFLLATPLQHNPGNSMYKDTAEAIVDATRIILQQCERAKTVRRVIHTASVTASSPLKENSIGFKDFINESCWSPLNISYAYSNPFLDAYVHYKSVSEKELLNYNDGETRSFEVVTLACGLVGGHTMQPHLSSSLHVIVSPLTGVELYHNNLKFLQALLGSVPLLHVEDACEAHVFCMEQQSIAGRFLCASGYPNMQDFLDRFAKKYPELKLLNKEVAEEGVRIQCDTNKLVDLGFRYKYGVEEILDDSVECAYVGSALKFDLMYVGDLFGYEYAYNILLHPFIYIYIYIYIYILDWYPRKVRDITWSRKSHKSKQKKM